MIDEVEIRAGVGAKKGSGATPAGADGVPLAAEGGQVGADGARGDIKSARQVNDGGESNRRFGFRQQTQETVAAQGHLALALKQGCVFLAGV